MFNKKIELPKLSYLVLSVNLEATEQWMTNQRKIQPIPKKGWEGFNTKEYKITILPTNPFTFYHSQVNEFQPSIDGLDIISNDIGCIHHCIHYQVYL
jgi:hypothetical protein